jgi:FixJ family two-component response regulator
MTSSGPRIAGPTFRLGRHPAKDHAVREPLIAVIDDDEPFRMALVECVSSLGYGARGFASAEEFLAWEADSSCNCVITDIHMPGMSGLDLARLLTGRSRGVPVLIVTARSDLSLDAHAAANGAICTLRKPFTTGALIQCLEKALKV